MIDTIRRQAVQVELQALVAAAEPKGAMGSSPEVAAPPASPFGAAIGASLDVGTAANPNPFSVASGMFHF